MTPKHFEKINPGIGATKELSLRVSVAALVRVLFNHPRTGDLMLALERKATLHKAKNGGVVEIKSKPFGGGLHIHDLETLRNLIGDFHFDSQASCSEQDFRLFIRPSDWDAVRQFCLGQFNRVGVPVLEIDPGRELAEEFAGALKIGLNPDQYIHKPIATVVENNPAPTENFHAQGYLTARVYRIFEACISDSSLARALLTNSESVSDQDLCELALGDARKGGKGWANAVLALPMKRIRDFYLALSPEERNTPILFEHNRVDDTVPAILDEITVPKYQKMG